MHKVSIDPHWRISYGRKTPLDTAVLLPLLEAIQTHGAILSAAKTLSLSYRHAWGLLREAEMIFGTELLEKKRGRGTSLTDFATTLLWAQKRIAARLQPTLQSLSSELENELAKSLSENSRPLRLYASHGFAVSSLMERLGHRDLPVNIRYMNGAEALAALAQGDCEIAGFHFPVEHYSPEAMKRYRRYLSERDICLVYLATLRQGLLIAKGNPKKIRTFRDLTRNDVRFVNRQIGSSTRELLEVLLDKNGIDVSLINGFETTEFTHAAIAAYIASNMADAGFGVETAARRFNLDFLPAAEERYFLAVPKSMLDNPVLTDILDIMKSPDFEKIINSLGGYYAVSTGKIYSVSDIFPE